MSFSISFPQFLLQFVNSVTHGKWRSRIFIRFLYCSWNKVISEPHWSLGSSNWCHCSSVKMENGRRWVLCKMKARKLVKLKLQSGTRFVVNSEPKSGWVPWREGWESQFMSLWAQCTAQTEPVDTSLLWDTWTESPELLHQPKHQLFKTSGSCPFLCFNFFKWKLKEQPLLLLSNHVWMREHTTANHTEINADDSSL